MGVKRSPAMCLGFVHGREKMSFNCVMDCWTSSLISLKFNVFSSANRRTRIKAVFQWCVFFSYVYVRVLNTRQWTSLRILSTPYVYVYVKNHWKTALPIEVIKLDMLKSWYTAVKYWSEIGPTIRANCPPVHYFYMN